MRHLPRAFVGLLVIVGFFGALWFVLHSTRDTPMKDALLILVGTLGAKFGTVVDWHYGSSSGSERKTEILSKGQP